LYRIANNLFLNIIDHEKVLLKFETEYQGDKFSDTPDFELELKEFDRRLQESLNEMDERNRTVFLMNRIDDLTYVQIAENLGLSVKAVEKRISKAMGFLKERLDIRI
jgi:RNA polymerase sigma factor (sigma-70 family)